MVAVESDRGKILTTEIGARETGGIGGVRPLGALERVAVAVVVEVVFGARRRLVRDPPRRATRLWNQDNPRSSQPSQR